MAGIVLAAGASRRMEGALKLLLPYGRGTVLESVVEAALAAELDPVLVVVGHRAEEVRRALRGRPLRVVENPDFRAGQGTSLAAAVRALASTVGGRAGASAPLAVAVLLADEPGIRSGHIREVVEAWAESGLPAARARYRDRPGHPVVFARSLFPRLARAAGEDAGSELLDSLGDRVRNVHIEGSAPVDVDTRASYREALAGPKGRDPGEDEGRGAGPSQGREETDG